MQAGHESHVQAGHDGHVQAGHESHVQAGHESHVQAGHETRQCQKVVFSMLMIMRFMTSNSTQDIQMKNAEAIS